MDTTSTRYFVAFAAWLCGLACAVTPAMATVYTVDGQTNVIGGDILDKSVLVTIPGAGAYTFELSDSDFRENYNTVPQRHVVVMGNSSHGDLRTFTLNGIGDSQTLYCNGNDLHLLFIDDVPHTDNRGSSTVIVRQGDTLVNTYVVDGQTNVIGGDDLLTNSVLVPIPTPGDYAFTLLESDFRENYNTDPQRHVVVMGNSTHGDLRTFTLNGVGDSQTLYCSGNDMRLLFIDGLPHSDNRGSSTVDVSLVPEPATLSLLGVGGLALMRRRR